MHLYLNDRVESVDAHALQSLLDSLPEWRHEQALRFKHLAGQRECALAYHLLCEALRTQYHILTPPHFTRNEHGKPTLLEHPHLHFNLSHCRVAVLCALHDAPIGVDVERIRPFKETLARYTMNEEEMQQILQSNEPALTFCRLWTAKEAVVKLKGTGLQGSIPSILTDARHEGIRIHTYEEDTKGYAYSVATYDSHPLS